MNDFEILPLFPSAVFKTKMKRTLSKNELKFVNKFYLDFSLNLKNGYE